MASEATPQRPGYDFPWLPRFPFAFDLLLGRRRSFARDSALVMAKNPYPRRFEGFEQLPQDSSFIIVMNHYNRPGLHPYHCAMAASAAVAGQRPGQPELSWLFTSEWYGRRFGLLLIPTWLIRWLFGRVGRIYDFIVLPRRVELVMARASSLRHVFAALAKRPVAMTPEGIGTGHLTEPPAGSGLFLTILSEHGYPLFPLAVFEEDSTLVLRLGRPLRLSTPRDISRDESDRLAREQTMVALGRLLPREYWGAYAAAIERSLSEEGAAPE
ncbi:MAG TPA: hypothetical protein VM013_01890 [Dehalococcoidia bacterium]|nr:hypothetical protein [Dehalococcoidia bacterium]